MQLHFTKAIAHRSLHAVLIADSDDSNPELIADSDNDRADEPDGESDDGPHAIEESLSGER